MSSLTAPLNATTSVAPDSSQSSASSHLSTSAFNQLNEKSFLKLMTTQLQHQDPTQPVSQTQMASEMAQFSTATGIDSLNSGVNDIASAQQAGALSKAAGLVGKQVTTNGNALVTNNSGSANGAFALSGPAKDVRVTVSNADGETIDHVDLGRLGAGSHTFGWNKGSPNQAYQFSVDATDGNGAAVQSATSSLYTVNGVQSIGGAAELNLAGNSVPLALSKVQQVL